MSNIRGPTSGFSSPRRSLDGNFDTNTATNPNIMLPNPGNILRNFRRDVFSSNSAGQSTFLPATVATPPGNPLLGNILNHLSPEMILRLVELSAGGESQDTKRAVGSQPDDERLLVAALHTSVREKQSCRQALNSLHGVNGHDSNEWKDYYLEHKLRIDDQLSKLLESNEAVIPNAESPSSHKQAHPPHTSHRYQRVQQPSHSSTQPVLPTRSNLLATQRSPPSISFREVSPINSHGSHSHADVPRRPTATTTTQHHNLRQEPHSRNPANTPQSSRRTASYSTKRAGGREERRMAKVVSKEHSADVESRQYVSFRQNVLGTLTPPSRSPTPVMPGKAGNRFRFTAEDHRFLVQSVQWQLKKDPSLTRIDICRRVGEKAGHHSVQSWSSYWGRKGAELEEVYMAAKQAPSPQRVIEDIKHEEVSSDLAETDLESIEDEPDSAEDEDGIGRTGDISTQAEYRTLARYIASIPNWEKEFTTRTEHWKVFCKRYTRRSAQSWVTIYSRYRKIIRSFAMKYGRLNDAESGEYSKDSMPSAKQPVRLLEQGWRQIDATAASSSAHPYGLQGAAKSYSGTVSRPLPRFLKRKVMESNRNGEPSSTGHISKRSKH